MIKENEENYWGSDPFPDRKSDEEIKEMWKND